MPWLDWLSLLVRWFHVIAGVAWIGASFYFIWLDNNLRTPPEWKQKKGIKGDLWAVHGGGFYEVAKYEYGPEKMPSTLHWFKWEAYSTWLSGMALLVLVYYFGASAYLIDPTVLALTPSQSISFGLLFIVVGWALYELACRSKLGLHPKICALLVSILVIVSCWVAASLFSGRGAYIHVGALLGTIMVGNVFFNIMPGQRKMVDAVANEKPINPKWGANAKLRSVHNNYFTLPLLFIMISNHYPMTYQHDLNWLILVCIIAISAYVRHYFNLKHNDINKPSILVIGGVAMAALALFVSWPKPAVSTNVPYSDSVSVETLDPLQTGVFKIVSTHCTNCHSATPTDPVFTTAPLGVMFDTWEQIEAKADIIVHRAAVTKDMPLMNKTHMTQEERQLLVKWLEATR
jgi:uncharacterized membrane protein